MKTIEQYATVEHGIFRVNVDVMKDGRFLDRWAEECRPAYRDEQLKRAGMVSRGLKNNYIGKSELAFTDHGVLEPHEYHRLAQR